MTELNGDRQLDGSSDPQLAAAAAACTRANPFNFFRFFHLARRFWNHTCNGARKHRRL